VADPVEYESRGPVVTLWLNRPEVKNAYDLGLLEALADGLTRAEEDEDARLVVSAWGSKTRSHLSGRS
jgi:enoyl-CoA hydratase/carnithine racemase